MSVKSALIVVDMQHDFCSPDGSLCVRDAMDTVPLINKLLGSNAFAFKVATKDWHPSNHMSFASNHPEPDNKPFESFAKIGNVVVGKPHETMQQRLWPDHCIQGTKGAELIPELMADKVDLIVEKGSDERVEMYSAFSDSFGNLTYGKGGVNHDLAQALRDRDITNVFCVGVAGDYCVNFTALDTAKAGFTTFVIEEGQKCVDPSSWPEVRRRLEDSKVTVIKQDSEQVQHLLAS